MSKSVLEVVTFRLAPGASGNTIDAGNAAIATFLRERPGFVARRLAKRPDGSYLDIVEWASLAEAKSAADNINIMSAPGVAAFMQAIDPPSIIMEHNDLIAQVN
jgi:hypothetical protein